MTIPSDYQCPFCGRHFRTILPQIERDYIETGKVKYIFRDFPLEAIHKQAMKAAESAHCAGEQGKYWEMHDRIFSSPKAMGPKKLQNHAQALELNLESFQTCVESGKQAIGIRQDIADGRKAGVRGTPTLFLGLAEPKAATMKPKQVLRGVQSYPRLKTGIDELLKAP